MNLPSPDVLAQMLWRGAAVGEICVLALLLYKRFWRILPVFTVYVAWAFLSDLAVFFLNSTYTDPTARLRIFTIENTMDSVLQLVVLVELAWSVLKPVRKSLPKASIIVLAVLVALAGLIIWPFAAKAIPTNVLPGAHLTVQLVQTVAILRVACFLVMAGFSQVLAIGWRDRELQVATGFGLYAIVALMVGVKQSSHLSPVEYAYYDSVPIVGYLCSLFYWVLSFAAKEQKRKEFTPQMQNFLLLMSGGRSAGPVSVRNLPEERQKKDK